MDLKASATLRCVYPTKLYDRYGHVRRLFMQPLNFYLRVQTMFVKKKNPKISSLKCIVYIVRFQYMAKVKKVFGDFALQTT